MSSVDVILTKYLQTGLPETLAGFRAAGGGAEYAEDRLGRLHDRMIGFGAAGAGAFAVIGGASLKAYGQIQMAEIAYTKSLGSIDAARMKIEELRQLDRQSPFSFTEMIKGGARLKAVGFEAGELKSTLQDIGDAAAGTMGSTDDFMGIGRAMGQMRSKGKVSMEEINQLADRNVPALQILQKQLKLTDEELSELMAGNHTIDADKAIPALLKGFRELYGGSMLEASKTFPGQVSNLQSAVEQLGGAMGEVLANTDGFGPSIKSLTDLTDSTREFVKANPELVKMALLLAGVGAGGVMLAGAMGKVRTALEEATLWKNKLTKATKLDDAAEIAKTVTANREATAIRGVAKAAGAATTAKELLARSTTAASQAEVVASTKITRIENARRVASKELSRSMVALDKARVAAARASDNLSTASGVRGQAAAQAKAVMAARQLGDAAKRTQSARDARAGLSAAQQAANAELRAAQAAAQGASSAAPSLAARGSALLGRAKTFVAQPLMTGAQSMLPGAADRYKALGFGRYRDMATGRFVARDVVKAWEGQLALAAKESGGIRNVLGRVTVGQAAGGVLGGAGAGYGVYSDVKALGASQGEAIVAAVGTGVGAAALMAFNPVAAALLGAAGAIRGGVDAFINRPAEEEAERGDGLTDEQVERQKGMSNAERSKDNFALAQEKMREASEIDTTLDFAGDDRKRKENLEHEAERLRLNAVSQARLGRREEVERAKPRISDEDMAETRAKWRQQPNRELSHVEVTQPERVPVVEHRNGAREIVFKARIPQGDGDRQAKQRRYNSVTAAPDFAY